MYGAIGEKNRFASRQGDEMPLTPADVRNKQFSTTRLRPGYDEEEVDAFLDEVEAALDELIQENEELRAKLAEVLRGKPPVSLTPQAEVPEVKPAGAAPAGAGAAARAGHACSAAASRGQHGHGRTGARPRSAD